MSHSRENRRCIVHVDMDAFFASIEQRDDPGLRGKPVVVGADPKESLFTDFADERKERLHSAMDRIKERFGSRAIYRAGGHAI